MLALPFLFFFPAQIEVIPSAEFTRNLQVSAISATVHILNTAERAEGSGVIIGRKGEAVYILTARHLIGMADRVTVSTFSLKTYPKPTRVFQSAKVVAVSKPLQDLALLRLLASDEDLRSLSVSLAAEPEKKFFQALSVGCSYGGAPTCMLDKVVSRKKVQRPREEGTAYFWEVERKHVTGRSGGPLLNERGEVIGICSGTSREKSYFCHPIEIRTFLRPHGLSE